MIAVDLCVAVVALVLALALQPWRMHTIDGPPWPTYAIAVALPLLWSLDRLTAPTAQPLSGAPLLVLFAGWPWAVIALVPVAAAAVVVGHIDLADGLHRLVWLGVGPASLAVIFGVALRRILPQHFFVYILGRAFIGTIVACAAIHVVQAGLRPDDGGVAGADRLLGGLLSAFAEGTLTGMLAAIAVAFRPDLLVTYSDRLYLPPRP